MNIPRKQSIPFMLQLALIFWAVAALTYIYYNEIFKFVYLLVIIPLLLIGIIYIRNKKQYLLYIIIALTAFMVSGIAGNNLKNINIQDGSYPVEITEDMKSTSTKGKINNTLISIKFTEDFEVQAGDIYVADCKIKDYDDWKNGITKQATLSNSSRQTRSDPIGLIYNFRYQLIENIRSRGTDEPEQLLNAIVCGQRIDLNKSKLYDSFKNAGLAHLVAVSGAHLSLVTTMLLIILRKLKIKKHIVIIIQSIFIFAYLICAAIPISALRAAFMAYVALFSFYSKRRPAPLNALGVCILILIAINPQISVSISFALSAGSTIGIILFSKLIEYWFRVFPEFIRSAISLTLAAGICAQPLSISIFNQLPIISPLSNIICTPIFSVLCTLGLISAIFTPLLPLSLLVSNIMCEIVKFLAGIPYASIALSCNTYIALLITLILAVLIYVFWPTKVMKSLIPAIVIVLLVIFIPNNNTEIDMLDVGQGDSILLRSAGKTFMIDTGNKENLLKQRLAEEKITHLDGLFITHPDDDHCGCVPTLMNYVQIDGAYIAQGLQECNCENCNKLKNNLKDTKTTTLKVGDKISFGEITLDIIWPDKYKDQGGNADSLTMIACTHDTKTLLCGDAEFEEIETMYNKGRLDGIDIYKVGHHGSKNALNKKVISPKISLVSVGKNKYGHPAKTTLDKLSDSQIYRTDEKGTIKLIFRGDSIDIETQR